MSCLVFEGFLHSLGCLAFSGMDVLVGLCVENFLGLFLFVFFAVVCWSLCWWCSLICCCIASGS